MNPIIIGITGGIGSGKSSLATLLRTEGYFVYDSDKEARRLQNEHPSIRAQLISIFGNEVYTDHGLNRSFLAQIVFSNKGALLQLNAIIHPFIRTDLDQWIQNYSTERLLFVESAIMIESGLVELMDKLIVITASEDVRINRVMKRDNISKEQVMARMLNQMPDREKLLKADFVIQSDDQQPLVPKMRKIIEQLIQ
jgi:dephospho-CoA kinase